MRSRSSRLFLGAAVLSGLSAQTALAQGVTTDDLKKDIESIREMLKGIQKDIQDMKANMARAAGPPSAVGVVIDLANNPFRGEKTAKLTLVEFSDYQ